MLSVDVRRSHSGIYPSLNVQPVGHSAVSSVVRSRSHTSPWSPSAPLHDAGTATAVPVQVAGTTFAVPVQVKAASQTCNVELQPSKHSALPSVSNNRSQVGVTGAVNVQLGDSATS